MKTENKRDKAGTGTLVNSCAEDEVRSERESASLLGSENANDSQLIEDLREALGYTSFSTSLECGSGSSSAETPPNLSGKSLIQRTIGEFELIDEIGRGGMGVVYRARQPSLGRDVAVKIVSVNLASGGSRLSRFRTETRAIARLNHPNIVPIYAQGEHDSAFYFAMGLIEGCSLATAIRHHPHLLSSTAIARTGSPNTPSPSKSFGSQRSGDQVSLGVDDETAPLAPPDRNPEDYRHLAGMLADVADGLAHAHDHGVVHRDIKPQNLLLSVDGRMYLSDFGLARMLDEPGLTISGQIMGTPAYLSPEQIRGNESGIDHRTDIYSLGVTLYELLTGRRPFSGRTRQQVTTSICEEEPVAPRKLDRRIPRDLETICVRAMSKDPARRFGTAHLLAEDLRRFAAGKPILSKPPGKIRRVLGGARRYRAAAGIGGVLILCLLVGGGFAAQIVAGRRDKANTLLQSAYDQLVYFDYRSPQQVTARIDEAQALGASASQVDLVRALANLGSGDNTDAISRLRKVLPGSVDAVRAQYMLAWGLWRISERAESREIFDRATAMRNPQTADEWFFRGLASHFDRPKLAIEAYQQANAIRAAQQQFFPQAVLHLARAYNQEMYATRSDAMFEQAQAILLQLIQQGHYKAYPYYLLSISQRLGGDILQARLGDVDSVVTDRFQAALDWARLGQTVDPQDDRPITAEAECLERLGLFDEAIAVRTRALEASAGKSTRCEALHYRWRLHFWTGNSEAAGKDIAAHAECDAASVQYAHVYPSWIAAESGNEELALQEARDIAEETPDDAQAILWSAASLQILGHADEAQKLLSQRRAVIRFDTGLIPPQTADWVKAVYDLSSGLRSVEEVIELADQFDQPQKLKAEAYFHAAAAALGRGQKNQALVWLARAVSCFDSELRYTYHAKALLGRLQFEPDWPHQDREVMHH